MKRSLSTGSGKIDYELKRNRRSKRLRLSVGCDSAVVATAPWFFPAGIIDEFIRRHAAWILHKVEYFKNRPQTTRPGFSHADFAKNKKAAYVFAKEKLAYYNQFFGFKYNRISIKAQKTRWGSCSRKGNLNFNYKIVLLPEKLADYIIVHELCHLKEMNHSQRFWNLVARAFPDYRKLRHELKNIF